MSHRLPEDKLAECERFVRLVVAGKSVEKIASEMSMTSRSVYNWLRRPAIKKRIARALDAMLGRFIALTARDSAKGHRELVKLLSSESDQVRLGAARALVADMAKIAELRASLGIEDRIAALERADQEQHPPKEGDAE